MFVETSVTVMLDPVKDAEIVMKYKNDPKWEVVAEGTMSITFQNRFTCSMESKYVEEVDT